MLTIKILIYMFIFLSTSSIGILISKRYSNRVNELKEFKNALNIFRSKIKFTYETIPEIFEEISQNIMPNIASIFQNASRNMDKLSARRAWDLALDINMLNITRRRYKCIKKVRKSFGKHRYRRTNKSNKFSRRILTKSNR